MGAQARRPVFRRMRRFSANQTSLGIDHLRQANEPETTRIELWRGSGWNREKHALTLPSPIR